jgi:hypothetical protein
MRYYYSRVMSFTFWKYEDWNVSRAISSKSSAA